MGSTTPASTSPALTSARLEQQQACVRPGASSTLVTSSAASQSATWTVLRPHSGESVQLSVKDSLVTLTAAPQPAPPSVLTGGERSAVLAGCRSAMELLDVVQNTLILYSVPEFTWQMKSNSLNFP